MKLRTLLTLTLLTAFGFTNAQNWNTAITGFSSYDVDEFEKAKTAFETALKHSDEFKADENAKLNYYYGLSILKLSDELREMVKAYEAFEMALQYDTKGSGSYKGTLEVEMDELKEKIKSKYNSLDHHVDDRSTLELFKKAATISGYKGDVEDYEMKLKKLGE